jgi:hypothetical protein
MSAGGPPDDGGADARPLPAARVRALYAGVLAALAAEIVLLAWLTGHFR